jgi:hypothetical protein
MTADASWCIQQADCSKNQWLRGGYGNTHKLDAVFVNAWSWLSAHFGIDTPRIIGQFPGICELPTGG